MALIPQLALVFNVNSMSSCLRGQPPDVNNGTADFLPAPDSIDERGPQMAYTSRKATLRAISGGQFNESDKHIRMPGNP
jgi:hypothetical protein